MDAYTIIVIVTLVGFFLLAALLLVPVYLFLKREEKASQRWTRENLARRSRQRASANESTNGSPSETSRPQHPES